MQILKQNCFHRKWHMHIVFNSNSNKRVLYFTFLLYRYIFTHCLIYHGMAHFLHLSFLFILYSNVKVLCYKSRIEFSSKGFFYSYFLFFFLFFKTVYEFTTNLLSIKSKNILIIRTRSPEKIYAYVCKFWSITVFVINDICILKLFLTVTARKSFLGLWKKYLDFENIYIVNHIYCKSYVNSYPVYINLLTFCLIYFGMTHLL